MSLLDKVFGGKGDDHYLKGMDYYSNGQYEQAIAEFEEVVSATHDLRNPYYNLGVFYKLYG